MSMPAAVKVVSTSNIVRFNVEGEPDVDTMLWHKRLFSVFMGLVYKVFER